MKKIFTILITLSILSVTCPVIAETTDEVISPRAAVCEYMVSYSNSTLSTKPYNVITLTAVNNTSTAQQTTLTSTRQLTFSGNVSVAYERQLILSKLKLEAEVGFGITTTQSVAATITVPARTTYYVDLGSAMTVTTGYLTYTYTNCSTSKVATSLEFTTGPYVEWYE